MITKKMKEIENHFDNSVNVINAERKEQKKIKEKIAAMRERSKAQEEAHNLSIAASKALSSTENTMQMGGLHNQSLFQDSLVSSYHGDLNQSDAQMDPSSYEKIEGGQIMGHFASVDQTNMQVLHSMIREKRP